MDAYAEVKSVSKGKVTLHRAVPDELVWVGEFALVTVCGGNEQEYTLAGADLCSRNLNVERRGTANVLQRGPVTHRLLKSKTAVGRCILAYCGKLVGPGRQFEQTPRYHLRHRLGTPAQNREELYRDLIIGQGSAIKLGGEHPVN